MELFEGTELQEADMLRPIEHEDEALQRNILAIVAKKLLRMFGIEENKFDSVRNAVGIFWGDSGLAKMFRETCCTPLDKLQQEIYDELGGRNNGERANYILEKMGFSGADDFLRINLDNLKKALLNEGIDVDAAKKAREFLS